MATEAEKKINYLPKDEEEKLLKFIWNQVKKAPVVKSYHGKWKELVEWQDGNQFTEWREGELQAVKLKRRKKMIVINLMKPLSEALEGKMNFTYQLAGMPNTGEAQDISSARVATKLLSHNDHENAVEELFEYMKYDLIATGNAWFTWQWMEDDNNFGYIPKLSKGATIENGRVIGTVKPIKQPGEVIGYVPSAFNIRPDTIAKIRGEMRHLIEIKEIPKQELIDKLGLKAIAKETVEAASVDDAEKFVGVNIKKEDRSGDEDTDMVAFYWERKSRKWPKGRLLITMEKICLYAGPNPALGEIPFWHFGFKKSGVSLWHTGPMHHVQSIQRELNRNVSIISEHIEGWKPKVGVPEGSIVKKGAYTSDSLELVSIDSSEGRPFVINTPELSSAVTAFRDFLMSSFNVVSNVHEVSYSQLPKYASRAPASLFSMMLEQEAEKISPMLKAVNMNIREMGSFRLRLMDEYYEQKRLIKVVGEGEKSSIEYFKGAELNSNFDVKLVVGVSLHQSKIIQQRLLLELKEAGVIEDNNKIIKLLNMGDISEDLRGDVADESRAERENQSFMNDTYDKDYKDGGVEIYPHDDHELHMDKHTNLAKSAEAQTWDDKKRTALDTHIDDHFRMILFLPLVLQVMTQQAQAKLGVTPGGGGLGTEEITPETAPEVVEDQQVTPEVAETTEAIRI